MDSIGTAVSDELVSVTLRTNSSEQASILISRSELRRFCQEFEMNEPFTHLGHQPGIFVAEPSTATAEVDRLEAIALRTLTQAYVLSGRTQRDDILLKREARFMSYVLCVLYAEWIELLESHSALGAASEHAAAGSLFIRPDSEPDLVWQHFDRVSRLASPHRQVAVVDFFIHSAPPHSAMLPHFTRSKTSKSSSDIAAQLSGVDSIDNDPLAWNRPYVERSGHRRDEKEHNAKQSHAHLHHKPQHHRRHNNKHHSHHEPSRRSRSRSRHRYRRSRHSRSYSSSSYSSQSSRSSYSSFSTQSSSRSRESSPANSSVGPRQRRRYHSRSYSSSSSSSNSRSRSRSRSRSYSRSRGRYRSESRSRRRHGSKRHKARRSYSNHSRSSSTASTVSSRSRSIPRTVASPMLVTESAPIIAEPAETIAPDTAEPDDVIEHEDDVDDKVDGSEPAVSAPTKRKYKPRKSRAAPIATRTRAKAAEEPRVPRVRHQPSRFMF